MSSGGVFQLIANDGKADELIMASCLLKSRIAQIKKRRAAAGEKVISPTLGDLERTHVLFMHASFKPFAAFGMEYRKITPSGSPAWDAELNYNIPQAGDFFSDFGIKFTVSAPVVTGHITLPANDVGGANTYTIDDISYSQTANGILAQDGTGVNGGANVEHEVRFVSYPGERAVEKLSISVNANTLDEYTKYASASYRKHNICASKLDGYKRLVGQEVERSAKGVVSGTHRKVAQIADGLQTAQEFTTNLTFWHVGRLWFANVKQQMVPSVSIPYGDRRITVKTATKAQMMALSTPRTSIAATGIPFDLYQATAADGAADLGL